MKKKPFVVNDPLLEACRKATWYERGLLSLQLCSTLYMILLCSFPKGEWREEQQSICICVMGLCCSANLSAALRQSKQIAVPPKTQNVQAQVKESDFAEFTAFVEGARRMKQSNPVYAPPAQEQTEAQVRA